jgi:hypothetical protein
MMTERIHLLDAVALAVDLPQHNLYRGQVGTVVEVLAPNVFEIEFSDNATGQPYAMLPLKSEQLLRLHFAPVQAD